MCCILCVRCVHCKWASSLDDAMDARGCTDSSRWIRIFCTDSTCFKRAEVPRCSTVENTVPTIREKYCINFIVVICMEFRFPIRRWRWLLMSCARRPSPHLFVRRHRGKKRRGRTTQPFGWQRQRRQLVKKCTEIWGSVTLPELRVSSTDYLISKPVQYHSLLIPV